MMVHETTCGLSFQLTKGGIADGIEDGGGLGDNTLTLTCPLGHTKWIEGFFYVTQVCIKATTFLVPLLGINLSILGIRPCFPFCFYLVFLCLLFITNRLYHLATPLNSNLTKYSTRRN